MKRSVIVLTILLIASIAGTYTVYELYVKERMRELGDHVQQEEKLRSRITELESMFFRTNPQVVVETWRASTQPWSDAVEARSQFYTLGSLVPKLEYPEEEIPKIYYSRELPKRIEALKSYAADKNVNVADTNCGVPGENYYGQGSNPSWQEITKHLRDYDYCSGVTKMLIDARPVSISPLVIWPEEEIPLRSGSIKKRTLGISVQIRMQTLVQFLDQLTQSNRYFRLEEFKVTNTDLWPQDPTLTVEMVLSQATYAQKVRAAAGSADSKGREEVAERLSSLFGADAAGRPALGGRNTAADAEEEKPKSWWYKFRRNFLPF